MYRIEQYIDNAGEHRWRFVAHVFGKDEIMADGGEGYKEKRKADHALSSIARHMPQAIAAYLGTTDRFAELTTAMANWERSVTLGSPDAPVLRQKLLDEIVAATIISEGVESEGGDVG